jgi:hypothetical protein
LGHREVNWIQQFSMDWIPIRKELSSTAHVKSCMHQRRRILPKQLAELLRNLDSRLIRCVD